MELVLVQNHGALRLRPILRAVETRRSLARVARHTAAAAEVTFEQTLRMESMATRAVAGCLGTMVTAASLATALEHPDTLIGDKWCFWSKP